MKEKKKFFINFFYQIFQIVVYFLCKNCKKTVKKWKWQGKLDQINKTSRRRRRDKGAKFNVFRYDKVFM